MNVDWGECGLGRCAIVGRIPYWGCKSNLCGADLEGGGSSNLTGADRGRMWIGAVSPASAHTPHDVSVGTRDTHDCSFKFEHAAIIKLLIR